MVVHHAGVHKDRQVLLQKLGGHKAQAYWPGTDLGTMTSTWFLCPHMSLLSRAKLRGMSSTLWG